MRKASGTRCTKQKGVTAAFLEMKVQDDGVLEDGTDRKGKVSGMKEMEPGHYLNQIFFLGW